MLIQTERGKKDMHSHSFPGSTIINCHKCGSSKNRNALSQDFIVLKQEGPQCLDEPYREFFLSLWAPSGCLSILGLKCAFFLSLPQSSHHLLFSVCNLSLTLYYKDICKWLKAHWIIQDTFQILSLIRGGGVAQCEHSPRINPTPQNSGNNNFQAYLHM